MRLIGIVSVLAALALIPQVVGALIAWKGTRALPTRFAAALTPPLVYFFTVYALLSYLLRPADACETPVCGMAGTLLTMVVLGGTAVHLFVATLIQVGHHLENRNFLRDHETSG